MLKDLVGETEGMSMTTLDDYISALERLFVVGDISAWCPSIRSATVIRSGKKRCLVDPSIAVAALGLSPRSLELDLRNLIMAKHESGDTQCPLSLPDLLIVLTGGEIAYRRTDGVLVVPIGSLRP